MIFDIIFALFIIYGFYKGFSKGLINSFMAIFTYLLGFSIALKCSIPIMEKMTVHFGVSSKLAPIFSFIVAFSLVVLFCQVIIFFIERFLKVTKLSFLNKQLGALAWCVLVVSLFSVITWIMDGAHLISENTKEKSIIYPVITKIAPNVVNTFKTIAPFLKESFDKLEIFFNEKIIL